ncbi:BrnA antitoxin family protein [Nostoc sp. XA010]|uniref:BrnA antitoxin family protein n=1 Tax=Nostoc sp. XA010 TaxID=2780407 RepID=UPI001E293A29|nr:BrnA antitoxin family protein [Nostoc sp. XA010]MCC5657034.1 BrnA antitoxin family protein [Nostoc sp. XA010]
MKAEVLKKRLDKNRPMTTITIRIPEDVIEDLKRVAPLLGFSGYQPLVRAYMGQGLRADIEQLEGDTVSTLIASLKRHGVSDEIIGEALSEATERGRNS